MPMTEKSASLDTDHEADTAYGHWFRWAARYREPLTEEQQAELDARVAATLEPPPEADAPMITALVPNQATLGSPNFTLSVQGTGFTPGSVIVWNGADEATTYVSSDELTTDVNMATAEAPVTIAVEVRTGALVSNSMPFTFAVAGATTASRRR